jgi:hypothetical protein
MNELVRRGIRALLGVHLGFIWGIRCRLFELWWVRVEFGDALATGVAAK